jgi:hypothetical protein
MFNIQFQDKVNNISVMHECTRSNTHVAYGPYSLWKISSILTSVNLNHFLCYHPAVRDNDVRVTSDICWAHRSNKHRFIGYWNICNVGLYKVLSYSEILWFEVLSIRIMFQIPLDSWNYAASIAGAWSRTAAVNSRWVKESIKVHFHSSVNLRGVLIYISPFLNK